MKITVIGPTYPYKGGISHFSTLLVRNLRKKHNVNFISWKRQYPSFLYPVEQKDTESKDKIVEKAKYILDFLNPFTWIKAFIDIKKSKSEYLILNWVAPVQAPIYFVITLLTKLFTKTKVKYICHNVLPHERSFYDKTFAKLAFYFADSFIVHSSEDKKILEKLVKNKEIKLGFHPIYDVFNTGKKYNIEKVKKELGLNKNVLLFFGYIRPYKGLKYLLKAMPGILKEHPDTSLLVVGEFWSKDKQSYFDLVKKLKIENNVIFIDKYVPNEEVGKYFSVCDVVVLPYVTATQSGIIQIAYSFDKPVITTSVGGLKDVVINNQTGYFIKTKNFKDIAHKVNSFYQEPISLNELKKIKLFFGWNKYISFI